MQYRTVFKVIVPLTILLLFGFFVIQEPTPNAVASEHNQDVDPIIEFTPPETIYAGVSAEFSATVKGKFPDPQFTWQFGDGGTASGNPVNYVYANGGTYPLTVFASSNGEIINKSIDVNVEIIRQTVTPTPSGLGFSIVSNAPIEEDEAVKFIATAKNDANAIYVWDFGDGSSAEGRTVSHNYKLPPDKETVQYAARVTLLTTDRKFLETSAAQSVTIEAAPIRGLDFYAEQQPAQGNFTRFVATKMSGSNVKYLWHFGDGERPLTGNKVDKAFNKDGLYEVSLTASNSKGSKKVTYSYSVQLTRAPLCTDITIKDNPKKPGDKVEIAVTFDHVDSDIYTWAYGDGVIEKKGSRAEHFYGAYQTEWKYPIVVSGSNRGGFAVCYTVVHITFEASVPSFTEAVPVTGLSFVHPFRARVGESYKFAVSNSDPAASYEWVLWGAATRARITLPSTEPIVDIEFSKHDRYVLTVTKKYGDKADAQSDYVIIANERRGYLPVVIANGSLRNELSSGSGPIVTPTSVSESTPSPPNATAQPPINTPAPTATPVTPEAERTKQAQETQTSVAQTATAAAPTDAPLPTSTATMVLPTATATLTPLPTATDTPIPTATSTDEPSGTIPIPPTATEPGGTIPIPDTD